MNPKPPVFLARSSYRLRRAMDAARMLPVIGAILFLLPLLWHGGYTRQGIVFLFLVWLGLIIVAAALSRPLNSIRDDSEPDTDKDP